MPADAPVRMAFVGQRVFFEQCALQQPAGGVEPSFVDFRQGADAGRLRREVDELDADVVFVFRPETIPAGLFAGLRALTLGYLTEPLPRSTRGPRPHPDLLQRLTYVRAADAANFDRFASFDPLIAATAADAGAPIWRAFPIPVADEHFTEVQPPSQPPRAVFVGRSTAHRERFLVPVKHVHDVLHVAHGATGERLRAIMRGATVAINLHNEPYPTFENRVALHLAAGHLVISEPLSPRHGLEPGVELLEAPTPDVLLRLVGDALRDPQAAHPMRLAGRRAAERFRASVVFPRIARELLEDVARSGGRSDGPPRTKARRRSLRGAVRSRRAGRA
ncbi:MAG: hypothetical protein H0T43_02120 [Solirubrobacterales bacterium]|nr:hypothetical protein [Solirubrobacterales bacterium]